tara:strand:+ start:2697 stop:3098 length:402 start_codon:yes stop_codon:yes gene_type:complete
MQTAKIFFRVKNNDISSLKLDVYKLMTKTYIELGQKPSDEQIKLNSRLLYNDLIHYYGGMTMEEVSYVFEAGVRDGTDGSSCFLNVRQWSVWLKKHKTSEALLRQTNQLTMWDRYQKSQKQISLTINQAKLLK